MAKKEKSKRRKPQIIKVPVNCPFCKNDTDPSYKDYRTLAGYVTERAKIIGSSRSGICSKHQRMISREIKRARHLALLPFTPSV